MMDVGRRSNPAAFADTAGTPSKFLAFLAPSYAVDMLVIIHAIRRDQIFVVAGFYKTCLVRHGVAFLSSRFSLVAETKSRLREVTFLIKRNIDLAIHKVFHGLSSFAA